MGGIDYYHWFMLSNYTEYDGCADNLYGADNHDDSGCGGDDFGGCYCVDDVCDNMLD